MSRPGIIAIVLAVVALLAGCSAVRFAYNRAPDLVYWWLDGYADFDNAQKPRARAAIADWFAWHRRTQLADYADLLARGEAEALADTTQERACQWWRDINQRVDVATERLVVPAADLLLTLTPEQIAHIERRYARFDDDFRDDYLQPDLADRQRATEKRTVERAEMLYGRLEARQKTLIRQMLAESPFDPELWFAERRYRQQEALQMMRTIVADHASREEAQAMVRSYFAHMKQSPREAYRAYSEQLAQFNCGFAARLHNQTTAVQRQAAVRKLRGWEADLRALAADTGS